MEHDSIFSKIIKREIPAEIVFEDERVIAIKDINPQASVHVLVIPKDQKYTNVVDIAQDDPSLLAHIVSVGRLIAQDRANGEFRLIFNTGASAGQTVFHAHAHILCSLDGSEQLPFAQK